MMIKFTPPFIKALNWITGFTILLLLFSIFRSAMGMQGYSIGKPVSGARVLLNLLNASLYAGAFWYAVSYITKEKKGAIIAAVITLLIPFWIGFETYSSGFYREGTYANYYWISMFARMLAFAVFGLIYFKNKTGLILILVYIVMTGAGVGRGASAYFSLMDDVLGLIGLEDLFEIRFSTGERSYRSINLLSSLVSQLFLPLKLIVFWAIFTAIQKINHHDVSLRTVSVFPNLNKVTISIVYWVFRLILITTMFGAAMHTAQLLNTELTFKTFLRILFFGVSIYVLASLFRNFLTSWFVSKGKYPAGLYFFLNIPILNFFIWLKLLFTPKDKVRLPVPVEDISLGEEDEAQTLKEPEESLAIQEAKELQRQFVRDGRNNTVKTMLLLLLIIIAFIRIGTASRGLSESELFIHIFGALFSIGLTLWYFTNEKALFIIFIIQFVFLLLILVAGLGSLAAFTPLAGLMNLFVLYALFHFDRLGFVEGGEG